jgi:adenylylsulfate reductase subunit A
MRFIALRCKDTIAPTGTIAQGVRAKQMNGLGEIYETKYGVATCERVYGTTKENQEGRGPCYLKTDEITKEQEEDLYKAYLNMAPSQTLKWLEGGQGPSEQNVEIEGTEPYIVGGHTASGYWVDNGRATTIKGLYAAGDVCGGAPQKYVTGALVEGKIAAESMIAFLEKGQQTAEKDEAAQTSPSSRSRRPCRKSWTPTRAALAAVTSSTRQGLPSQKKKLRRFSRCSPPSTRRIWTTCSRFMKSVSG